MATKYVSETKAGKSVSAYVILNKKGEQVAIVRAHFSDGGTCIVNVWDNASPEMQFGKAGGYGYDKFTAALSGMTIDGHELSDHSSRQDAPKPPKGRRTFPADYKPRKGFSLANYTSVSKATGNRMHSYTFRNMAETKLGFDEANRRELTDEQWQQIGDLADKLEKQWRESDDCESGFESCFRESGLDYLKALGYRVIQAI